MEDAPKRISLRVANLYQDKYPDRHLIGWEVIVLRKMLREQGYHVVLEPDDGRPVDYLVRKGVLQNVLSDPLVVASSTVAVSVITSIFANWLSKVLFGGNKKSDSTNIAIQITKSGTKMTFDHRGNKISAKRLRQITKMFRRVSARLQRPPIQSPYPHRPWPIYLEHDGKIVGWCRLETSDQGLEIKEGYITDDAALRRLKKGEIKGASICGVAKETECSICGGNFVDCIHVPGRTYNGSKCGNRIKRIDLIEVSLVRNPANPKALVKFKAAEKK